MYYELGEFLRHMARRHRLWMDGEFWTALVTGSVVGLILWQHPEAVRALRERLADLLTVASIVFGFVLTALVLYIQAASEWSSDPRVGRVAESLVDWHVWTIFCLLLLIVGIVVVWLCEACVLQTHYWAAVTHGSLVFLAVYCILQILNHTLTVRWVFRNRRTLKDGPKERTEHE